MKNEGLKALLDMVGGILAFLAAFLFLAEAIIKQGWFEAPEIVGQVLAVVKQYGLIVLIGIVGLEFVSTKNFIIKLLFIVAMASDSELILPVSPEWVPCVYPEGIDFSVTV